MEYSILYLKWLKKVTGIIRGSHWFLPVSFYGDTDMDKKNMYWSGHQPKYKNNNNCNNNNNNKTIQVSLQAWEKLYAALQAMLYQFLSFNWGNATYSCVSTIAYSGKYLDEDTRA